MCTCIVVFCEVIPPRPLEAQEKGRHTWQGGEDIAWNSEHVMHISSWLKLGRGSCLQIQKHDFSRRQR
jgi:hypothetical protein